MTGSQLPRPRRARPLSPRLSWTGTRSVVAALTGAALVLGGAAAGVTAWAAGVGGRGVEPEAVAPASSIAFARLDLNPSLGQKLDIVRFARTVSAAEKAAGVRGTGPTPHTFAAVRTQLLDAVLGEVPGPVPLNAWFAGRAAIAAYPDRAAPGGISEVGILQYDNVIAMRRALSYEARTEHAGYAVDTAARYVVVADSARLARRGLAAGVAHPLAADPTFRADVASLPQHDDPGLIWADVTAPSSELVDASDTSSGSGNSGGSGGSGTAEALAAAGHAVTAGRAVLGARAGTVLRSLGRVARPALTAAVATSPSSSTVAPASAAADERLVIGLRIEPTAVDVQGRLRNVPAAQTARAGRGAALSGLNRLPTNALAALSVAGLGPLLGGEYTAAVKGDPHVRSELRQAGIGSAGDLRVLFGSVTTAAVLASAHGPGPVVAVAAKSPHPARGLAVATRVLTGLGVRRGEVALSTADGRILLRTPAASRPVAGSGALGSTPLFRAAVPDAATADALCFVNVTRSAAADTGLTAHDRAELSPVTAVGFSSRGGADAGFNLRVTIR